MLYIYLSNKLLLAKENVFCNFYMSGEMTYITYNKNNR